MVTLSNPLSPARRRRRECGALMTELTVAIGVLLVATLPLASSVVKEMQTLRAIYYRALAMEIVDGEMEVLVAGEWQSLKEGSQPYAVRAASLASLPPGKFSATRSGKRLRLEWVPNWRDRGGPVVREATLQ